MSVPLFLLYSLGLLMASPDARSGADFLTSSLLNHLSPNIYVIVQLVIATGILGLAAHRLRGSFWFHLRLSVPVLCESVLYGLALSALVSVLITETSLLGPIMVPGEWVDRTVIAAGAGLHEELVFRQCLIPLLLLLLHRVMELPRALALIAAVLASSILFSLTHHLAGEPFAWNLFVFRSAAGCLFAGLFLTRGFAVAAWTHASYDFYVLSL